MECCSSRAQGELLRAFALKMVSNMRKQKPFVCVGRPAMGLFYYFKFAAGQVYMSYACLLEKSPVFFF